MLALPSLQRFPLSRLLIDRNVDSEIANQSHIYHQDGETKGVFTPGSFGAIVPKQGAFYIRD